MEAKKIIITGSATRIGAAIARSLAGYDIRESVKIWERMKESQKGEAPPEWMSTHPSADNRIISLYGNSVSFYWNIFDKKKD